MSKLKQINNNSYPKYPKGSAQERFDTRLRRRMEPSLRIDYTAIPQAYDKYKSLQRMFTEMCKNMAMDGLEYECYEVRDWMRSNQGFVRAHTPYFVTMDLMLWRRVVKYIRHYNPEWYNHIRYYGTWVPNQ